MGFAVEIDHATIDEWERRPDGRWVNLRTERRAGALTQKLLDAITYERAQRMIEAERSAAKDALIDELRIALRPHIQASTHGGEW